MANRDYVPTDDAGLSTFVDNYVLTIHPNPETFGLTEQLDTELGSAKTSFTAALAANAAAQSAARVARQTKDLAAKGLRAKIRQLTKMVQANPSITDAQRADLGVTIPDRVPTAVPDPITVPVINIDFSNRGEHKIHFKDSATPNSKAKPAGAAGMSLWAKVAAVQPAGISTMEYIGLITKSGHRLVWEESQYGQQVFYVGCWQTASGKRGALGDFTNATISK